MGDPLSDTRNMIDDWERNAVEKAAKFQAMADRVSEVRITESVADGAVSVTVGNNGLPTDIAMTDRVKAMTPAEIAANVLAAMRKAQARYPQALAEIVAQTVGDDPAGRHVVATAEANFPAPDDEEPPPSGTTRRIGDIEEDERQVPPPPRPPRRSTGRDEGDDGDFGDESILR
ncbi:YbaB/EbfC family nucleoid-associated protein [Lentzea sp. BCCO 10_0061]|uniref:YbaB/EbfC family nucleoid-associated protein n=1 Tax=Lentzea sokolovensis TaxID=3095429 RepID=A0ABU4UQ92_9PSEU|nr:YbaB/EbfC family nucleoid-associated protein [Lentzea sp. BCCO 10_0061]MDX8141668.1 YbaB/EbfC family nucleoid-associated protein [Lentzea sp. BCCO 10_0061]